MPSSNFRKNLKSALLLLSVVCLWGSLSACDPRKDWADLGPSMQKLLNFIGVDVSPVRKQHIFQSPASRQAFVSPSTQQTNTQTAPFFGNLMVVTQGPFEPADSYNDLWRQANCSVSYMNYILALSSQNQLSITPTEQVPNFEKTIHANAYLTSTPDVFPHGCTDNSAGIQSNVLVIAGKAKNGAEVLATYNSGGIISGTINSYDSFTGPTDLATNYPPFTVVAGDLNKDGDPDIVSINTDGLHSSITVFLGNDDGSLKPGVNLALPGTAAGFGIIDDVDGDGIPDIVVVSASATATFSVFLGKGDGTFQPIQNVLIPNAVLTPESAIITADVNGDGHKDIIGTDGEVFLGKGDGSTWTLVSQRAFGGLSGGSTVVAADFNNDGKMDLATDDTRLIRTYKGNGDGTFTAGPTYPTIGDAGHIYATDIDGDGNVDLWSGYAGDGFYIGEIVTTGYALMGNGDGTFQGAPNLPFSYNGSNLVDLNGDGRADFVGVLPVSNSTTIATYLTPASGIPAAGPTLVVSGNPGLDSLALGDVTGDKIPDVVFLSPAPQAQSFYVAIGKGDGSFQAPTATPVPILAPSGTSNNQSITGVRLADINNDGKLDLVYSFFSQDSVSPFLYYEGFAVQLGNGDGTFKSPQVVYTYQNANAPQIFPSNILNAIVDVNGDNFPDVFVVLPNGIVSGTAQAIAEDFIGNGDGTFKTPNTLTVTPNLLSANQSNGQGSPFAFADLNGDGKMDMVVSGTSVDGTKSQLAVCLGNGDGTFKSPTITLFAGFGPLSPPALADFDGDGKIDLALSAGILPGNGDGTFQSLTNIDGSAVAPFTLYLQSLGAAVATDINGDGKPDFVSGTTIFVSKYGAVPPVLASTSTTVTSSQNPSTVGANVTFTATVISATAGTITGTVAFFDGATQIGTGALNGSGMATYSTTALTQATHSITAQYGGDSNYATSTSPAVSQVVNGSGTASTTTALVSSLNPSTVGASVTFTATVSSIDGRIDHWHRLVLRRHQAARHAHHHVGQQSKLQRDDAGRGHAYDHRRVQRKRQLRDFHVAGCLASGERRLDDHSDQHGFVGVVDERYIRNEHYIHGDGDSLTE